MNTADPNHLPVTTPPLSAAPSSQDMQAYREGRLDLARFEEIDAWLAGLPGEEQALLLGEPADWLPGLPAFSAESTDLPVFATEPKRLRYRILHPIGAGGMGIVEAAYDDVLGREVALKRCRPRRPDESPATYAARLRAFKREAAITAQLEHPGIVPVHDVGSGSLGEPAFVMKKLDGVPLQTLIAHALSGNALDLASIAETMLRLAEAIAYAHHRGVVHRDLKPDNVIVGALGAVYVIDWGLAAMVPATPSTTDSPAIPSPMSRPTQPPQGTIPAPPQAQQQGTVQATTAGTFRLGTPAWMAPEQFGPGVPDPRMDVFALGGLLMALLTGCGPRETAQRQGRVVPGTDLSALDVRALPRGLVAVARRCLAADPSQRYQDGAAVADELRHWLSAGLTQAERPSPLTRLWAKMRHSPRLVAALSGLALAAGATVIGISAQAARQEHRQELHDQRVLSDLARNLDIGNESEVHAALTQVQLILKDHLGLAAGQDLLTRLNAAEDVFAANSAQKRLKDHLDQLREKYLQKGPWDSEADELLGAIRASGYLSRQDLHGDDLASQAAQLRSDPLLDDLLAALVRLDRALLLKDPQPPLASAIPHLISAAGNTPGWRAVGEVLAQTSVEEHDLLFPHCPAADTALEEAETADQLLATFAPEPRLIQVARERWHLDANAFWPRVISARDCIARGAWREAERHALVALGREPDSLWPHLILAYVALADHDDQALMREAQAGLMQNPQQIELLMLKAVALAHTHHHDEAQALIDHSGEEEHLLYHLLHHSEHPLERTVEALVAAGIHMPGAPQLHAQDLAPADTK